MKKIEVVCPITVATFEELTPERRQLVEAAREAVKGSYAPYSNFHVGAAIRLADGGIVRGANQENAATPSSLCAERVAAFWAGANGALRDMRAIAIAAADAQWEQVAQPITPCGACRQVLLEYETLAGQNIEVMLVGLKEIYIIPSVKSLVPVAFTEF